KWFHWNGFHWEIINTNLAFHFVRELARQLAENQKDGQRSKIEGTGFARGVERFAMSDPKVAVTAEYWNRDPWLLGTPGGTLDLPGSHGGLIRFLQQWCGYSLPGITREHALVFVYGPGGNGKSVFLNTVTTILKDYSMTSAMETFTASTSDKHPTDLAMLAGA